MSGHNIHSNISFINHCPCLIHTTMDLFCFFWHKIFCLKCKFLMVQFLAIWSEADHLKFYFEVFLNRMLYLLTKMSSVFFCFPTWWFYEIRRVRLSQCYIVYTLPWTGIELTTLVVISTDCTGSCKSNYHMTTIGKEIKFTYCNAIYCLK
jgi:hypothetical protein